MTALPQRPLRFCFPTTFYPPYNFGGDGINVQRLARALVRRGHEVTVVHDVDAFNAVSGGGRTFDRPEPDGVDVIGLRSRIGRFSAVATQQSGWPIGNRSRLRAVLDSGRLDVIHFHNISLIGGPGLLSYGSGVAKLYSAHEHWLVCPTHVLWRHRREPCPSRQCIRCQLVYRRPPQLWRYTGVLKRNIDHVDEFIAFSEFSRLKHREFGFPRDMRVLPCFVPPPGALGPGRDASPHDRPYFLFSGRLERMKGLDDVIPVFRRYAAADLLIAGEGSHMPELMRLAEGIPQVRFLGSLAYDRLQWYYEHAIATIVCTIGFETFGAVVAESLAHRTPVIGRDRSSVGESVRLSGGGELFTDPPTLLRALERLGGDAAHRAACAASGYLAYTQRWSEDAVVPAYLDLVFEVLNRRGKCAQS